MEKTERIKPIKNKIEKWIIFEFILLSAIIPLITIGLKRFTFVSNNKIMDLILFGIQGMAPSLAAVISVFSFYSLNGLKVFLKEKYYVNINYRYCLIAFLVPMGLLLFAKTMTIIYLNKNFELVIPNAKKLLVIFLALIAEELGWRGFLQERIERKTGIFFAPLFVGLIWGLWNYNYFISGIMNVPFTLLILGCVFESYGYFVITKLTKGNILPASIWHFSGNLFLNVFSLNTSDSDGRYLSYLITTFSYIICVIGFLIYYQRHKNVVPDKNKSLVIGKL
jgi:membrane protease YdiL (CAAX protease family)